MEGNNNGNTGVEQQDYRLNLNFDEHKIIIHHRYEWIHILNDIIIAVWFFIGSIFFFYSSLTDAGTWLFVIGSGQMMVRPVIRIAHKIHVGEIETRNIHF